MLLPSREGPCTEGLAPAMDLGSVGFVLGQSGEGEGQRRGSQGLCPMARLGQPKKKVWGRGDLKLTLSNLEKGGPRWVGVRGSKEQPGKGEERV